MNTYEEVAKKNELDRKTAMRFVEYMKTRWGSSEIGKCQSLYASEWADRFKAGIEYAKSDSKGQAVLYALDAQDASKICSGCGRMVTALEVAKNKCYACGNGKIVDKVRIDIAKEYANFGMEDTLTGGEDDDPSEDEMLNTQG